MSDPAFVAQVGAAIVAELADALVAEFEVDGTNLARAALRALREPSEAMVDAVLFDLIDRGVSPEIVWRAMVDALLYD